MQGGEGSSCQNRTWKLQPFSGTPRKKLFCSETKKMGKMYDRGEKKR